MVGQVFNVNLESELLCRMIRHCTFLDQYLFILLHKIVQKGRGLNSSKLKPKMHLKSVWTPIALNVSINLHPIEKN